MQSRRARLCCAALAAGLTAVVHADGLHGYFKFGDEWNRTPDDSLDAALGDEYFSDVHGDLRLIDDWQQGAWSASVHGQLLYDAGGAVALQRKIQALPGFPPFDPEVVNLLNVQHTVGDGNEDRSVMRLDRLFAGYTGEHLVLRAGRQAITWGTGLIFHPMDLFDPFAPNASDTEYKTGVDMLYGQWLFADGSDLQGLAVPRRGPDGGGLRADQSSLAFRYHRAGNLESAWMLAVDHDDAVAGISLGGPLFDATWSTTIVPTLLHDDALAVSGVLNLSRAATWWSMPVTTIAEYYHNGFGHSGDDYAFSELSSDLTARLARGEDFVTGRDYLGTGISADVTPLLKIAPTAIVNLRDGGALALLQATYSLSENAEIVAFGEVPLGAPGSEFRGLPVLPGVDVYAGAPTQVYVRFAYYF